MAVLLSLLHFSQSAFSGESSHWVGLADFYSILNQLGFIFSSVFTSVTPFTFKLSNLFFQVCLLAANSFQHHQNSLLHMYHRCSVVTSDEANVPRFFQSLYYILTQVFCLTYMILDRQQVVVVIQLVDILRFFN